MVRQTLQFERDRPQPLRAQRRLAAGQSLQHRRMRGGVGDGGVTGHGLHLAHRRAVRSTGQRGLDAAMLIAQGDLEVQHFLAGALESEVSRLDDAGMHRPHGHFMHLRTLDAEKLAIRRRQPIRTPHRLQPGMTLRREAVLLPDLALEHVRLRMRDRERRITAGAGSAASHREGVVGIVGEQRDQPHRPTLGHAEPGAQPRPTIQLQPGRTHEVRGRPLRDVRPRQAGGVGQQGEGSLSVHGVG